MKQKTEEHLKVYHECKLRTNALMDIAYTKFGEMNTLHSTPRVKDYTCRFVLRLLSRMPIISETYYQRIMVRNVMQDILFWYLMDLMPNHYVINKVNELVNLDMMLWQIGKYKALPPH